MNARLDGLPLAPAAAWQVIFEECPHCDNEKHSAIYLRLGSGGGPVLFSSFPRSHIGNARLYELWFLTTFPRAKDEAHRRSSAQQKNTPEQS